MKGHKRTEENDVTLAVVLVVFISLWRYIPETVDKLTIGRILAVLLLLPFLWRYLKKRSEYRDTLPPVPYPVEYEWKQDFGNKIKNTKEIVGLSVFLVTSFYVEYFAFLYALAVYGIMEFAQYFLLESKRKIFENLLAVTMIVVFMIVIVLWVTSDFFSAGAVFLFLAAFLILFVWLFWAEGIDWLLCKILHASGRSRRKY